ncbi:uncharacterized protein BJ171DRAFT_636153 [Polychytrium aggregatum]|uniref:uncharacterized protein n=1 Tax=Polychytrium aggregatum TaxID=110093 RepID=UPI0022FDB639|nr:uncharacterized protein BJ171DRAFT_636153 [Polychytrium aggregatum]KAI9207836.1 hypothetical protein BJ171DRAFT_636153 [Polychytrium aggregatum]
MADSTDTLPELRDDLVAEAGATTLAASTPPEIGMHKMRTTPRLEEHQTLVDLSRILPAEADCKDSTFAPPNELETLTHPPNEADSHAAREPSTSDLHSAEARTHQTEPSDPAKHKRGDVMDCVRASPEDMEICRDDEAASPKETPAVLAPAVAAPVAVARKKPKVKRNFDKLTLTPPFWNTVGAIPVQRASGGPGPAHEKKSKAITPRVFARQMSLGATPSGPIYAHHPHPYYLPGRPMMPPTWAIPFASPSSASPGQIVGVPPDGLPNHSGVPLASVPAGSFVPLTPTPGSQAATDTSTTPAHPPATAPLSGQLAQSHSYPQRHSQAPPQAPMPVVSPTVPIYQHRGGSMPVLSSPTSPIPGSPGQPTYAVGLPGAFGRSTSMPVFYPQWVYPSMIPTLPTPTSPTAVSPFYIPYPSPTAASPGAVYCYSAPSALLPSSSAPQPQPPSSVPLQHASGTAFAPSGVTPMSMAVASQGGMPLTPLAPGPHVATVQPLWTSSQAAPQARPSTHPSQGTHRSAGSRDNSSQLQSTHSYELGPDSRRSSITTLHSCDTRSTSDSGKASSPLASKTPSVSFLGAAGGIQDGSSTSAAVDGVAFTAAAAAAAAGDGDGTHSSRLSRHQHQSTRSGRHAHFADDQGPRESSHKRSSSKLDEHSTGSASSVRLPPEPSSIGPDQRSFARTREDTEVAEILISTAQILDESVKRRKSLSTLAIDLSQMNCS